MATAVDALRAGGKREKIHDAQMVFKLPQKAKDLVKTIGDKNGQSEGAVVRDALAEYLERRGYRL